MCTREGPMQSVGVDVGGTFTDIAVVDSSGRLSIVKALSTPDDYSDAICAGLAQMIEAGDVHPRRGEESCPRRHGSDQHRDHRHGGEGRPHHDGGFSRRARDRPAPVPAPLRHGLGQASPARSPPPPAGGLRAHRLSRPASFVRSNRKVSPPRPTSCSRTASPPSRSAS